MPQKSSGRIRENDDQAWAFKVGGYQACEKWLKDRKGRTLTLDDVEHYANLVAALTRTRGLMAAIDDVVNGNLWPLHSAKVEPGEIGPHE